MKTLIKNATIVNEGQSFFGSILIDNDIIADIISDDAIGTCTDADEVVDALGCIVMPGVIDTHVHFREPGLEHKACIESESRAAAFGGVTSFFDMPNTNPQTTDVESLADKFARGAKDSRVNYSFFFGATNDNVGLMSQLDPHQIPGIKLFMGSSTGNMLVDDEDALDRVFSTASNNGFAIMTHCEDTQIINSNMAEAKKKYGDDIPIAMHPLIRSVDACFASSSKAVELAKKHGAHLHIAHVTTAKELELLIDSSKITVEVTPAHLFFSDEDYATKGARIKCNPAVKSIGDRDALRRALADGTIKTIGTDHAPHLLNEKQGGAARAVSGMPMIQFSLIVMLKLVDEGILSFEKLVELMCHNPAQLFRVSQRGFLRKGYKADIAIVRHSKPWTLTAADVVSRCGWSPLEGESFTWRVVHTFCNGHHIFDNGVLDDSYRGEQINFNA